MAERKSMQLVDTYTPFPEFSGHFRKESVAHKLVLLSTTHELGKVHILWDLQKRRTLGTCIAPETLAAPASLSPDMRTLAVGYQSLWLIDVPSGRIIGQLYDNLDIDRMAKAVFSPDGTRLVVTSNPVIDVFEIDHVTRRVRLMHQFEGHIERLGGQVYNGRISAVTLSNNGRFALSGDRRGVAVVWDIETNQLVRRLPKRLAKASERFLTPSAVDVLSNIAGMDISAVAFGGPESSMATVAERVGGGVSVYDVASGALLSRMAMPDPAATLRSVEMSSDGRLVLIGCDVPMLWDWSANRILAAIDLGANSPRCMSTCFTELGNRIITGHVDGKFREWQFEACPLTP